MCITSSASYHTTSPGTAGSNRPNSNNFDLLYAIISIKPYSGLFHGITCATFQEKETYFHPPTHAYFIHANLIISSRSSWSVMRLSIVISVRVHSSPDRSCMISAVKWHVRISVCCTVRRNSRASVTGLMRWARMMLVGHESARSGTTNGTKFCIANTSVLSAALPQFMVAAARGVVVRRTRAVALLFLVVTT